MGTPLRHGWKQLQGFKRDRSRLAGPTQDSPVGPGKWSRAGRAAWAPPGMGTPRPAMPAPAGLSGVWESPGTTFLHRGCSSSDLLPAHEPPALPESIGLSPPATSLVSLPVFSFPRAGSCSRVPVSCPVSVSPHLDQGITFTSVQVCWVAAETLMTGSQWGRPAEATVLLGMVLVHSQSSRMKILIRFYWT